jgi:hypothetical protein
MFDGEMPTRPAAILPIIANCQLVSPFTGKLNVFGYTLTRFIERNQIKGFSQRIFVWSIRKKLLKLTREIN